MLWMLLVVLFVMWALGFGFGVGGSLIHLLLVVALIVFIASMLSGRQRI
jgi:Family of unknown function (DUF5670)